MTKYYLPPEIWNKIIIMSNYIMSRDKKKYFKDVHKQLFLLFNDAYDYHIDKYIGYEFFIIGMDDDDEYEFDEEKIKDSKNQILYDLCKYNKLVTCIKAMEQNRQEYT